MSYKDYNIIKEKCKICEREKPLTFHHLIPRTLHNNRWFVKNFTKEQMNEGIRVCQLCHNEIHRQFEEKDLGRNYNTLEKLLETEQIKKFVPWAKKQK